jgi:hypothetical protein
VPVPVELSADVSATDDAVLTDEVLELERLRTRIDHALAVRLGELEARNTCNRDHALSTAAWLAHHARLPTHVAKARVVVADKLRRLLPDVLAALESGRIGWDHARVLADLANPRIASLVAENQEMLLGLSDHCGFWRWQAEVRGLGRLWDQDGGYDPNEDPNADKLSFGTTFDGLTSLIATLTGETAAVVTQAIETIADELYQRAVRDHEACADLEIPSRATLRCKALYEMARRAMGIDLDSSQGPKVEATVVFNASDPTDATDPDGVPLADGTTRTFSCDAELHPVVVDSLGVPLDLGRAVRLASTGQRRAVKHRDGGCVHPGCEAKVSWCDVHHCVHWHDGGVSDACNLVCLCRHHHGVVHRNGWSVRISSDGWAIFTSPSGRTYWGQRHGRQRAGPPPPATDQPPNRR